MFRCVSDPRQNGKPITSHWTRALCVRTDVVCPSHSEVGWIILHAIAFSALYCGFCVRPGWFVSSFFSFALCRRFYMEFLLNVWRDPSNRSAPRILYYSARILIAHFSIKCTRAWPFRNSYILPLLLLLSPSDPCPGHAMFCFTLFLFNSVYWVCTRLSMPSRSCFAHHRLHSTRRQRTGQPPHTVRAHTGRTDPSLSNKQTDIDVITQS